MLSPTLFLASEFFHAYVQRDAKHECLREVVQEPFLAIQKTAPKYVTEQEVTYRAPVQGQPTPATLEPEDAFVAALEK
jgi:hypothetical protein